MNKIQSFYHKDTGSFSHLVINKNEAAIIDPVLDYDAASAHTSHNFANKIIKALDTSGAHLRWILDTHVHADHLTAAHYIRSQRGGKLMASKRVLEVLNHWVPLFDSEQDTPRNGSQFDGLLTELDSLDLGNSKINILATPGHTPDAITYRIDDSAFIGDTLFMPDLGTARADFPGGSAAILYDSIQKIYALPTDTKLYLCHDYPPQNNHNKESREPCNTCTVSSQLTNNILIRKDTSKADFIAARTARDTTLRVPELILPAIQVNLRGGSLGNPRNNRVNYLTIPLNQL